MEDSDDNNATAGVAAGSPASEVEAAVIQADIQHLALDSYPEVFRDFAGKNLTVLFAAFSDGLPKSSCSRCGNNEWDVSASPPDAVTGIRINAVSRAGKSLEQFVPAVVTTCVTCGLIQMHAMEVLHKWWKTTSTTGDTRDEQ